MGPSGRLDSLVEASASTWPTSLTRRATGHRRDCAQPACAALSPKRVVARSTETRGRRRPHRAAWSGCGWTHGYGRQPLMETQQPARRRPLGTAAVPRLPCGFWMMSGPPSAGRIGDGTKAPPGGRRRRRSGGGRGASSVPSRRLRGSAIGRTSVHCGERRGSPLLQRRSRGPSRGDRHVPPPDRMSPVPATQLAALALPSPTALARTCDTVFSACDSYGSCLPIS